MTIQPKWIIIAGLALGFALWCCATNVKAANGPTLEEAIAMLIA